MVSFTMRLSNVVAEFGAIASAFIAPSKTIIGRDTRYAKKRLASIYNRVSCLSIGRSRALARVLHYESMKTCIFDYNFHYHSHTAIILYLMGDALAYL